MLASFQEKSAWIQLIGLILVIGFYLFAAGFMLYDGVRHLPAFVPLFLLSVIALVAVLSGSHVIAAIAKRHERPDERDRLIGWRAESNSAWILAAGVVLSISGMILAIGSVWIAHFLLLSLFVAELTKLVLRIIYYRRGV